MTFNALIVDKDAEGKTHAQVQQIEDNRLPDGDVTVAVEYSTLNYKDGLCVGPGGGLVKTYPHVPGIDFAGTVESSSNERFQPGDKVVLTGWRVGEIWWGGYAQKSCVRGEWLVPLPEGLSTHDSMAGGTA
ncbi:MAG: oxidoreductase, partial [Proteobacteria bacterium]